MEEIKVVFELSGKILGYCGNRWAVEQYFLSYIRSGYRIKVIKVIKMK